MKILSKFADALFYGIVILTSIAIIYGNVQTSKHEEMRFKRDSLEYEMLKLEQELLTK
jgi:hypothetical protein